MAKPTTPVLISPDGDREWTPESAEQAVNLRARGWTSKPADDSAGESTTDAAASSTSGSKTSK